jgi:uncharacterized protein (UPF0147 family)
VKPPDDSEMLNRLAATAHLMECAHDWMRIFHDESAPEDVRAQANAYAEAVRREGNLPESAA